ncbi:MAG TPA: phosphate acyltransferase, partial [Xanthobacteraceae bacterium]|nr:phosphate acyltransferase [Xanthobacteraceae bacterium]
MNPIERCFDTVRGRHFKIVLPEGDDIRVLAAARGLIDREIARPIVLGAPDAITEAAHAVGIGLDGIELIDPRRDARARPYGAAVAGARETMTP